MFLVFISDLAGAMKSTSNFLADEASTATDLGGSLAEANLDIVCAWPSR